ncbi:dTDP-4-dehydrorhamnose reductase [Methanobacterium petrolearium]|uniref:dTDP-4-dehydrorhamnose reductase n=1 Tax=Methanobacterium petrolearium TaxID=710190 RepID=UPI001AE27817|nr:dTDP-4-dehydrorhamnose reductase [Methanobacterium petrolearium]MBP1945321.1 dTDP-4-dehydrorhamnose reductase [Methanobacterium petrolearium]BDZ71503.1 NAD(P)-dependent oxidoreductase [Methanobacterium petrolearium]
MKVMIIGSEGMLGHDLVDVLSANHDISTTTIWTLDITDIDKTIETVRNINPDVVVHAAAFTDVDGSESKADLAYHVNALGTRNVAVACRETDSALVYICTDYVFDGDKGSPYYEYDQTNPLSVYGKTKHLGEVYIRDLLDKFYIVRTSWLYGFHGPNFITTMLKLAKTHDKISVVSDQIGSPTYTLDLAKSIAQLIEKPAYGIYHITNSDHCSWFEYAQLIFEIAGKNVELNPVTTEKFGSPAPRPKYSVLENYNWKMEGYDKIRSYKEALKDYMSLL